MQEIGLLTPVACRVGTLRTGQVGYVIAGMRSTRQARIGDTLYLPDEWNKEGKIKSPFQHAQTLQPTAVADKAAKVVEKEKERAIEESTNSNLFLTPVAGYQPAKPMLFASIYPVDTGELEQLYASVDRLCLNDSSIQVSEP